MTLTAVDGAPYTDLSLQTEIGAAACHAGSSTISVNLSSVPNRATYPHLQAWLATVPATAIAPLEPCAFRRRTTASRSSSQNLTDVRGLLPGYRSQARRHVRE